MNKLMVVLPLLLMAGCSSAEKTIQDPLELSIALSGNSTEYNANELVNISVFVKNNINTTYSINITLMHDNQTDYVWEQDHEKIISNYERWNVWKEYPGSGNWTIIVKVRPYNSSQIVEKNGTFTVK